MENNIIFGPINSRRFGVSLGIDLSPSFKQCNFDCLYCELAPSATVSSQKTILSVTSIIDELKKHLNKDIDVITLTANGEPTLYPNLDSLIDEIDKIKGKAQTLILTNSATLVDEKVFNSLLKLDQVKLSLDAISVDIFKKIDRPDKSVKVENIARDVIRFSKAYKGKLFIEILFVDTLNNKTSEIKKLNDTLLEIKASRVDIGTIDRPPAYNVKKLDYKELVDIAMKFDKTIPIHIASRGSSAKNISSSYSDIEILNTLEKRPLTISDIDILFDQESKERLKKLLSENKIIKKQLDNLEFFIKL